MCVYIYIYIHIFKLKQVFGGALGALTIMTILSALIGWLVGETSTVFGGKSYTDFAASLLFFYFGIKLLRESFKDQQSDSELAQVVY